MTLILDALIISLQRPPYIYINTMAPHLQDDCYDQLEMEQHSVSSPIDMQTPSDNDTLDDMIDSIAMDNVDREEHMYINLGLKEDCCSIQFTASSSTSSKDTLKSSKSMMIEESTHTTHRPASILRRRNSAPSKLQSFTPSSAWSSSKSPPKTNTMRRTSSVVRFPPSYSMVTARYTRPRTNLVELSKLYYSTEDIKRFKQEYRVERIILARQRQAQQQQQQQAQLISQQGQSEEDDKAAREEDTTIQIVEENGEVSSLSSSTPPTPFQPSTTTTSSTSHDNAYWRSKVSRRWGYGRRNSSSVRTISPERKDVPQEDSTSSSLPSSDSSQLEPLSSSLKKLLDGPERKSLSYLLDASPAYDSDDDSDDDDSDSSPTPAPPPKESSPGVGSPKSMFSSAFEHFHGSTASTMSSRQQCLVDTLYLF